MIAKNNAALLAPDNATYNVFLYLLNQQHSDQDLLFPIHGFLLFSEGWHSDGTTHYNITRGNNVFAYEDVAGNAMSASNNLLGTPADGGASRNFDFLLGCILQLQLIEMHRLPIYFI
jgi:hypothetical protein